MNKAISVKELRMNFPKIKKELGKGTVFTLIYRSMPIATLSPYDISNQPFGDDFGNSNFSLPKDMKDFLRNIDKYAFKGGEPFNAADEINQDRDET